MTTFGYWMLGGVALLVVFILLEGKRQARKYGPPSARPNLAGVGLLEVQRHLQADRHVGVLQQQVKDEVAQQEEDSQGDPEKGPGSGT